MEKKCLTVDQPRRKSDEDEGGRCSGEAVNGDGDVECLKRR